MNGRVGLLSRNSCCCSYDATHHLKTFESFIPALERGKMLPPTTSRSPESIGCPTKNAKKPRKWEDEEKKAKYTGVSENLGFSPQIIHFEVFHYKPSILGYHYFWKHPYGIVWLILVDLPEKSCIGFRR